MTDTKLPNVCVVTHPLAAAGENATRSLLDILAAITSVSLVTANLPADSEIRDRHEIIELTTKGTGGSVVVAAGRFLLNQIRMCRVIATRNEEIVIFYGATSYLLPILAARLLGKTVLVEPRGDVPLTLRLNWEQQMPASLARGLASAVRVLERISFAVSNGVITYTPEMARELEVDPTRSDVYPSGARYIRAEQFSVKKPYKDRNRVVGFLGRLDEEKGIRELAAVAKRLPENVTFRFIGEGDLRRWLESELHSEIEAGNVELTGWVSHDEVPDQLNDLSLLVLPSQPTEGLPTTILEALACGTPVCASPVSGVPDVVRDGETGFLVESRDPATLSRQIKTILSRDDLAEVSSTGRELVEQEYSFDAACERYQRILSVVSI